jgi:hypothetical protein
MRNLLAFLAAALVTFIGVGWYLDWYKIDKQPSSGGHQKVNIDINGGKIADDIHKGVQKGEEKLQDVVDKEKKQSTEPAKPADKNGTTTVKENPKP